MYFAFNANFHQDRTCHFTHPLLTNWTSDLSQRKQRIFGCEHNMNEGGEEGEDLYLE